MNIVITHCMCHVTVLLLRRQCTFAIKVQLTMLAPLMKLSDLSFSFIQEDNHAPAMQQVLAITREGQIQR